jgi:hypothetical protein
MVKDINRAPRLPAMSVPEAVYRLVERFDENRDSYRSGEVSRTAFNALPVETREKVTERMLAMHNNKGTLIWGVLTLISLLVLLVLMVLGIVSI